MTDNMRCTANLCDCFGLSGQLEELVRLHPGFGDHVRQLLLHEQRDVVALSSVVMRIAGVSKPTLQLQCPMPGPRATLWLDVCAELLLQCLLEMNARSYTCTSCSSGGGATLHLMPTTLWAS